MKFNIVWPECKSITEQQLRSWYADHMTTEWMRHANGPQEGSEWDNRVSAKWNQYFNDDLDEIIESGIVTIAR